MSRVFIFFSFSFQFSSIAPSKGSERKHLIFSDIEKKKTKKMGGGDSLTRSSSVFGVLLVFFLISTTFHLKIYIQMSYHQCKLTFCQNLNRKRHLTDLYCIVQNLGCTNVEILVSVGCHSNMSTFANFNDGKP